MYKDSLFWRYGLFQVPALLFLICLGLAGIAAIFGLGCPSFWVRLFLGLSWIAFTWMLVLPLDTLLRAKLHLGMGLTGRFAFLQAVFWSVTTFVILAAALPPLMQSCMASANPTPVPASTPVEEESVSLDWARWHANIWNQMFLNQQSLGSMGSTAQFSFLIHRDGRIKDIHVQTNPDDPIFRQYIITRIESLRGTDALVFLNSSRRDSVLYKGEATVCDLAQSSKCGQPQDPSNYNDKEEIKQPRL